MHPPPFRLEHRLSDWPECVLELHCGQRTTAYPVKLLLQRHGDGPFKAVLEKVKCQHCGRRPAPVYLCATHHRDGKSKGPPPDWAVVLTPEPDRSAACTPARRQAASNEGTAKPR